MKCGKLAWPMLSHNSQLSDGKGQKLVRTDSPIIKNLKTNKVLQIYREIGKKPVLSFGNKRRRGYAQLLSEQHGASHQGIHARGRR